MIPIKKYYAYCWQSGEIEVGEKPKKGTIVLCESSNKGLLNKAITGTARLSYNNVDWLVPKLPEEDNPWSKVRIAQGYSKILKERIKELESNEETTTQKKKS